MQPAQAKTPGSNGGNRALKRWGPIAGVVAVVAIVVGIVVATSGGDDESSADTTVAATTATTVASTEAPASTPATEPAGSTAGTDAPVSTGPVEITYPLSYPQAVEQGIADQVDWGDRCDTTTGQIAVPDYFAQPCMAPFTGDNGGATDTGVTADEITIVYYEGQEGDPIIQYITDAVAVDDTNQQQFETMGHIIEY